MGNYKTLIEKIKQLRAKYNLGIPDPIRKESIKDFSIHFKNQFEITPPKQYLDFLLVCDGLVENGHTLYASYNHEKDGILCGVFELNEIWHEQDERFKKYIYFGDGNMDLYVFNKVTNKYEVLDRYSGDGIEVFNSFEQMLMYILKMMIG